LVDAPYALATAAKSLGGRSKPTQNIVFKDNIPQQREASPLFPFVSSIDKTEQERSGNSCLQHN
jgi:hypothetical protein